MSVLPDFTELFRALWSFDAFPWQRLLAERLAQGEWPKALDLPTAAGKTACIDGAVYALAAQADRPLGERTAPRRIWFVVDRRIVVDEAFARAERIAEKLRKATDGPLKAVADRLRQISGTDRPLAVARLRGGVLRDDGWARLPSQPAVITSTVDQFGSRLLFRGYGRSRLTAPLFAGLAAHDSLILLDEAHCSVPFLQTLRAVERYRGGGWAESPIETPFAFATLSATLPSNVPASEIFPSAEARDEALDHAELRRRMAASKPGELAEVRGWRGDDSDPLVTEAVRRAEEFVLKFGRRRVAVVVNRVRTAEDIASALTAAVGDEADVVLLTGRLRPLERDCVVARWQPVLRADTPKEPNRPVVLVATQCIEVGADFSFDALVTEAASLDALRQRFGRLNRLGTADEAPATILIRTQDAKDGAEDPVYGTAMAACWQLLNDLAELNTGGKAERKTVDFGITALGRKLERIDDLAPYLAPAPDAPMLLPAHLDLLCQTAFESQVEPDVQLFLHGMNRSAPEARVVWRADLDRRSTQIWAETVALCPPVSMEALSVPLYRLRRWLSNDVAAEDAADVESATWIEDAAAERIRPVLLWRGRDRSEVCTRASELRPGDLVVLPASYGMKGLGQSVPDQAFGADQIDIWEPSHACSGRPSVLRLQRKVLAPWMDRAPIADLIALAETPDWDRECLQEAIDAVLTDVPPAEEDLLPLPDWLRNLLARTRDGKAEQHPAGGLVLFERQRDRQAAQEQDLFADDDDLLSAVGQEVTLGVHSALVERAVSQLAERCLPEALRSPLTVAAYWHDAGKLDERFQLWLRQGDELAVYSGEPVAKSVEIPTSPARRRWLREMSRLPGNFRHEMLSLQLAERHAPSLGGGEPADLMLHAIASHHGYARPFAPLSPDPDPPSVYGKHDGVDLALSAQTRERGPAPHSLPSGIPARFWRLTRRYGWWGLAYLEAVLRLGDWYASQWVSEGVTRVAPSTIQHATPVAAASDPIALTGIDGANPLGFLAAVGGLLVLHQAGYRDARLAWRRGVTWQPELHGVTNANPNALSAIVAQGLRGKEVSEAAEAARDEAQKRFEEARTILKAKMDDIRTRGLRGKERQQALDREIAPLERSLDELRKQWLASLRQAVPRPELALGKRIDCTRSEYRDLALTLVDELHWQDRESIDLLAAFASDGCLHGSDSKRKKEILAQTPFCFITGSGHQYFLDTARQLMEHVTPERVAATFFDPWTYDDEGLSMRWDPSEDRRYALMDRDPTASDNKPRTAWMANLLAYRALALFPSAPTRGGLMTTGWSNDGQESALTWPLWGYPIDPDTIRSLLLLPELHSPAPDRPALRARGIEATFRARRIKVGAGANFKINFTPAREL